MHFRWFALIIIPAIGIIASVLAWDSARFNAEPQPADVRAAYKLGISVAVVATDLPAIKGGQIPKPNFRHGQGNPSTYFWHRAHLERSGDCLDAKRGQPNDLDCKKPSALTPSSNRLVFSLLQDDSQKIEVQAKPLTVGQNEAFGAVYGVEGQIAIGRDFQSASLFKVEIDGGLFEETSKVGGVPDEDTVYNEGTCTAPRAVSLTEPSIIAILSAGLTRHCTFTSEDNRSLVLLQHNHGLLQWSLTTSTLHCKALLKTVVITVPIPDYAGCLSANWNETAFPVVKLVIFQSRGNSEWSHIN
jgi:hypothetical protein